MENTLSSSSYKCPSCDGIHTKNLGLLRKVDGIIDLPFPGHLYKCKSCSLLFRRPYVTESKLHKIYNEYPVNTLPGKDRRIDFDLASNAIKNFFSSGSILDIGCSTGDFLNKLPASFQKYGVELSEPAQSVAKQHGIEIVGSSLNHLEIYQHMFHIITFIDVIEHLPKPMESLKNAAKLLLPGGIIIISTGNTDALPWRLMRLDYWYYFPQHVSFFNLDWFKWACKELKLNIVKVNKFSHSNSKSDNLWYPFSRCLAFWVWRNTGKHPPLQKFISSFYPFNRICRWSSPPETYFWKDHMLLVLNSMK